MKRLRPLTQRLSVRILAIYQRLVPTESQRLFGVTIIAGAVCGLAAVAFHLSIKLIEGYTINRALTSSAATAPVWILLIPALGALLCGIVLTTLVPDARGSGVLQVKAAFALRRDRIPFRDIVGKFSMAAIQIGTGSSLGPEGPTVQICAGLASQLGRFAAISRQNIRRLLPVGTAAGIAAAFNAPIAAVTFAIEEIVGTLDQTVLSGVVVAAALAAVIERNVLGEHPLLEVLHVYGFREPRTLILYAALGIVAGIASVVFTDSLIRLRGWFKRSTLLPVWAQPMVGGAATGLLAIAALLWFHTTGVTGDGYTTLSSALTGNLTLRVLIALAIMKIVATLFSYGSGGAGGLFAPALFIGGMVGGAMGQVDILLFHHSMDEVGAFALVGMGAVFAGIIRAPMTSVLIIIEMTGGYSLILPLMIANMTAYGLARRWRPLPMFEALLEQDGVHLPHPQAGGVSAFEQLKVADAVHSKRIVSLRAGMTVAEAFELIAIYTFTSFPVLDNGGTYLGLITESDLRRLLAEDRGGLPVESALRKLPALSPTEKLVRALVLMKKFGTRQMAVVDQSSQNKFIGVLTMSDVMQAQANAVPEATAQGADH
ncbi:MAG TPA: chloride channel protein [Bacteroidota bacterium]|nr:chloride channel protein [Bacteroidota bacterium]